MQQNLFLILITFTFNFIRYGMVFPLIPLVAHDLGASPAVIGLIVGAFSLLSFFLAVPIGGFTDRAGVKGMIALGVFCNIASALLLLHSNHVMILIASQILGGIGFQLHIVSSQAYIARIDSPFRRERAFGYLTFSAAVGQTLGPVLGGLVASRYGYYDAFLGVLLFSAMGLVVLGLQGSNGRQADRYSIVQDLKQAVSVLSDSRMLAVLAFTFVIIFAVSLRTSFLPVLLLKRGLSEADVGLLISLFAGSMTVVRPFVGRIFGFFSRKDIMAFSVLTVAAGVGSIPALHSSFPTAFAMCVFGLGFGLTQPLSMVMVADLADSGHSGLIMGLRFMVITLGNLSGPVLLGLLAEGINLEAPFYASALVVVAIGVYIWTFKPQLLPGRREA
ncbi:MAG: MFS transporter [Deltaproteobacteria bacterium]